MKTTIMRAGVLAAALCTATTGQAAIITLSGDTVDFVFDDTQPGLSYYGSLNVVGDSIFATPDSIIAQAANGGNDSLVVPATVVTVVAHAGYEFTSATVGIEGDYTVSGDGASVSISNTLVVSEAGAPGNSVSPAMVNSGFGNTGGPYNWSSVGTADLSTAMWDGVTSIELSLSSILTASTTSSGESAQIQEKFTASSVVAIETSPVPVPAAVWLMGSGLLALFGVSARRRRQD